MDLNTALKWLSASVFESLGHTLREPEIVILKGTWRGLTYEQMAEGSAYSTNYLMRDVAPKLWRQLSTVFGRSVGKTSFRVALEAFAASSTSAPPDFDGSRFKDVTAEDSRFGSEVFVRGKDVGSRSPAGALENYQAGAKKLAAEARLEGTQSERSLYRHPAILPDLTSDYFADNATDRTSARASDRTLDRALEQFNLLTAGKTLYSGISLPAMSSVVMYGYSDELAQARQWLEAAVSGSQSLLSGETAEGVATTTAATVIEPGVSLVAGSRSQAQSVANLASDLSGQSSVQQAVEDSDSGLKAKGQLVGIWGLRGVGKTLLAERLVVQMGDRFAAVVRRSLTSRPSLADLSVSILTGLGVVAQPNRAIAQLLRLMAQQPLLIVLEGIEAILKEQTLAGDYQKAYRDYGEFFRAVPGSRSCVVITGLEGPAELVRQGSNGQRQGVRSLVLSQLSEAAATALIRAELTNLTASEADRDSQQPHWSELIARYQGHPMALKATLRVIRDIFNGRVDAFLQQSSVLFTDILRMLAPSFERLSAAEVNILYWLASQESALSLEQLAQTLPISISSASLVSSLDSLHQRSLIAIDTSTLSPTFSPPALIKAYALHQFVGQFGEAASASQTQPDTASTSASRQANRVPFGSVEDIIDLRPASNSPVALSRWIQGQYDAQWQSLERLFEASARPGALVRATYHLQDETYVKRFKSINLSAKADRLSAPASERSTGSDASGGTSDRAVLLVAIHQETENLYKVCVQAQPARRENVLPENLELRLLDSEQQVLATVAARQEDLFIQLPYFRGAESDLFTIEMVLRGRHHTETFTL